MTLILLIGVQYKREGKLMTSYKIAKNYRKTLQEKLLSNYNMSSAFSIFSIDG